MSSGSGMGLFGGNSNWRGPIWFPVNFLLIEYLQKCHHYLGDDFQVECPTGPGQMMNLSAGAGRTVTPYDANLSERARRKAAGARGEPSVSRRSELAGSGAFLRVLPRRKWIRRGRQPSDGLDRAGRQ